MNTVMPFDYAGQQVRTVTVKDEPWFVAKDVCDVLEIGNSRQAVAYLDDDEKGVISNDTPGGTQEMQVISEAGLYSLILRSRKPEAKAFKRWVTHEVLPTIRKHGMYATPSTVEAMLADPDNMIKVLEALKEAREETQRLATQVEEAQPKVLFANAVATSKSSILVGEMAKILKQNGVPNMGQNRFFQWLRENDYLIKRQGSNWNMPTQRAMEMGLFEIKETAVQHADGHVTVNKTPKITGKGQIYFLNKLLGNQPNNQ